MARYVLGIGGLAHDASAALIKDGELIAAIQEERLTRQKHVGGFPFKAVDFCLKFANINYVEIEAVAIYTTKNHLLRMIIDNIKEYLLRYRDFSNILSFSLGNYYRLKRLNVYYRNLRHAYRLIPKNKFYFVDHHDAHVASSFLVSPFSESLILCVDAVGDGHCTSVYYGSKNKMTRIIDVRYPNSVSHIYTLMTYYLGFYGRGNQYKVMGLSSYGAPKYYEQLKEIISFNDNGYELQRKYYDMKPNIIFSSYFYKIFGPPRGKDEAITDRHADMASSVQKLFEEVVYHICQLAKEKHFSDNLCMTGGSALNCVLNGKLISKKLFKNVFVPPGASDCGTAIGAAFYYNNIECGNDRNFLLKHDYWGNEFSDAEVKHKLNELSINYEHVKDPAKTAAQTLSDDKIVGWFQGRMEYGPRALGNRSILADPRSKRNKDRINQTIKFREEFRPFAPAIINEQVDDYLEKPSCLSPFMSHAFLVKSQKRSEIPSVVHIDGSARLQTVNEYDNALFYNLIKEFYGLTGIPVVLNTSFNLAGDAIVCKIEDAVNTFNKSAIDVLIIGNYVITKEKTNA